PKSNEAPRAAHAPQVSANRTGKSKRKKNWYLENWRRCFVRKKSLVSHRIIWVGMHLIVLAVAVAGTIAIAGNNRKETAALEADTAVEAAESAETYVEPAAESDDDLLLHVGEEEETSYDFEQDGQAIDFTDISVGQHVLFGEYEQDNDLSNGKEPIEWEVFDVEGDKALLISRYVLDHIQYNTENVDITWEDCSLRAWLNSTFLSEAFNDDDKNRILTTELTNEDNPVTGIRGGGDTQDKIFCLSLTELFRYYYNFENFYDEQQSGYCSDLVTDATPYARTVNGGGLAYCTLDEGFCEVGNYSLDVIGKKGVEWWLRSPGNFPSYASVVESIGRAGALNCSENVASGRAGVRPALWVSIDSQFKAAEGVRLEDASDLQKGQYVTFGSYEQDNNADNGKEPITWEVIAVEGDRTLLASKYVLDTVPYNQEYTDVTWETCTLRQWMNGQFYSDAFTDEEKNRILTSELTNEDNPSTEGAVGGNNTQDNVFCLSIEELNKYYSSIERYEKNWHFESQEFLLEATPYALSGGNGNLWTSTYDADDRDFLSDIGYEDSLIGRALAGWWLRSPGPRNNLACYVATDGLTGWDLGELVDSDITGVRPAIWVSAR
nr:DUF6273 domain-containing protein [Lachnospiraceae bacterium]